MKPIKVQSFGQLHPVLARDCEQVAHALANGLKVPCGFFEIVRDLMLAGF